MSNKRQRRDDLNNVNDNSVYCDKNSLLQYVLINDEGSFTKVKYVVANNMNTIYLAVIQFYIANYIKLFNIYINELINTPMYHEAFNRILTLTTNNWDLNTLISDLNNDYDNTTQSLFSVFMTFDDSFYNDNDINTIYQRYNRCINTMTYEQYVEYVVYLRNNNPLKLMYMNKSDSELRDTIENFKQIVGRQSENPKYHDIIDAHKFRNNLTSEQVKEWYDTQFNAIEQKYVYLTNIDVIKLEDKNVDIL